MTACALPLVRWKGGSSKEWQFHGKANSERYLASVSLRLFPILLWPRENTGKIVMGTTIQHEERKQ
jgi:hypothetical protein